LADAGQLEWRSYPRCLVVANENGREVYAFFIEDRSLRTLLKLSRSEEGDRGFTFLRFRDLYRGVLVIYDGGLARILETGQVAWHVQASMYDCAGFTSDARKLAYDDHKLEKRFTRDLETGELISAEALQSAR